jgi:hypothetical protein
MGTQQDYFRVLLLFYDELQHIEVLPFAALSSGLTFDGTAGGNIKGEEQLLSFIKTVGLDSFVRIEKREGRVVRLFHVLSPEKIVAKLRDRLERKTEAELKIVGEELLNSTDEQYLQAFEHVTLGSSQVSSEDGIDRSKQWFAHQPPGKAP